MAVKKKGMGAMLEIGPARTAALWAVGTVGSQGVVAAAARALSGPSSRLSWDYDREGGAVQRKHEKRHATQKSEKGDEKRRETMRALTEACEGAAEKSATGGNHGENQADEEVAQGSLENYGPGCHSYNIFLCNECKELSKSLDILPSQIKYIFESA